MNINNSSSHITGASPKQIDSTESSNYREALNPKTQTCPIDEPSNVDRNEHSHIDSYIQALQDWVDRDEGSSLDSKQKVKKQILDTMHSSSSELTLSHFKLATIPPVYALKHLQSINLAHNRLLTIEPYVFNGLNLTQINLSHNDIQSIPSNAFSGLPTIDVLDLSNNNIRSFSYNIFLGLSNSLNFIDLRNNELDDFDYSIDLFSEELQDELASRFGNTTYMF